FHRFDRSTDNRVEALRAHRNEARDPHPRGDTDHESTAEDSDAEAEEQSFEACPHGVRGGPARGFDEHNVAAPKAGSARNASDQSTHDRAREPIYHTRYAADPSVDPRTDTRPGSCREHADRKCASDGVMAESPLTRAGGVSVAETGHDPRDQCNRKPQQ